MKRRGFFASLAGAIAGIVAAPLAVKAAPAAITGGFSSLDLAGQGLAVTGQGECFIEIPYVSDVSWDPETLVMTVTKKDLTLPIDSIKSLKRGRGRQS